MTRAAYAALIAISTQMPTLAYPNAEVSRLVGITEGPR